jgi:hypothetical protein
MTTMAVEAPEIGSYEEAEIIAGTVGKGRNVAPEGWRLLGTGYYRDAYVSPSGTVYKVPTYDNYEESGWESNQQEYDNLSRLSDRPWAAKCSLHMVDGKPVVAMPLYQGRLGAWSSLDETGRQWLQGCGVRD